ncbi:hypothetical protein Leryth_010702 [Lithospermum erythrorhizon]|uniref:Transporter n=1 Tax=Lithospermum erythrorhizon TaxID=34254 RepID=A0AAV3QS35_LITER|nr:hypothetical protein Leryth_010702 [Lithospermum erythrorhizon]
MNNYYIPRLATIEGYKQLFMALEAKVVDIVKHIKKTANDDPRRVVHSFKVGLALTLVSLFYYFKPLYNNFGCSAMWAIMTVVVVFEYSVGATLGKGLNRALATFLAGALGVGAHYLANITRNNFGEPILLGIFVFLLAAASTFIRFFPTVKARYDYGMLIFILTFSMVTISGYRTHEILDLAQKRLSTIAIGASICVIISIVIYPVWAGEDLHKLVAQNIEKLGDFIQGFSDTYFKTLETDGYVHLDLILANYKSVMNSKNSEETLANFSRWEPGHGAFMYSHPWKQYLIIGSLTRQCASRIETINAYNKAQASLEIFGKLQEPFSRMSMECWKALKELSLAIKTTTKPSSAKQHILNSRTASKSLKLLLNSEILGGINMEQIIPLASVASIMIDVVDYVEKIYEAIDELASLANFENGSVSKCCHVVVDVERLSEVIVDDQSVGKGTLVIP